MQILVIAYLRESTILLNDSTQLVNLCQNKNYDFVPQLIDWMEHCENHLSTYQRSQVGIMAALRAKVLAAQAGVYDNLNYIPRAHQERKVTIGQCALLLSQAQLLMHDIHEDLAKKRDEATRTLQQMLNILIQNGTLLTLLQISATPSERINTLWLTCQNRTEVATGARQILALVSWGDALQLLDECLGTMRL